MFEPIVIASGDSGVGGVVLGAVLALVGGIGTNWVTAHLASRRTKRALVTALSGELKLIREDLATEIGGYCDSLRNRSEPTASGFALDAPTFRAILPSIGELGHSEAQCVLEAYSSLNNLANRTKGPLARFPRDQNQWVFYASGTLSAVMAAHNTLRGDLQDKPLDAEEAKILTYFKAASRLVLSGRQDFVFERDWSTEDVPTVLADELLRI